MQLGMSPISVVQNAQPVTVTRHAIMDERIDLICHRQQAYMAIISQQSAYTGASVRMSSDGRRLRCLISAVCSPRRFSDWTEIVSRVCVASADAAITKRSSFLMHHVPFALAHPHLSLYTALCRYPVLQRKHYRLHAGDAERGRVRGRSTRTGGGDTAAAAVAMVTRAYVGPFQH